MHNLNCQSYEGHCEAIIRYIGNQKPRSEKFVKHWKKIMPVKILPTVVQQLNLRGLILDILINLNLILGT